MTEKQKRFAIIGGTVLVAVLLLLLFRRGAGAGAAVGGDTTLPTVTGPSLGPVYLGGSSPTFVIPGLNTNGPNLNMIGACCSDCMQGPAFTNPTWSGPSLTINQGGAGPTLINYSSAVADGYDGFGGAIYNPATGTYQRAS